ncbi:MAG: signal peptidase II, partial [Pyrinomonadaceae bacterium]
IDFIDVQFGSWHYPTFNIADAAICAGAGLLVIDMILSKRRKGEEETLSLMSNNEQRTTNN